MGFNDRDEKWKVTERGDRDKDRKCINKSTPNKHVCCNPKKPLLQECDDARLLLKYEICESETYCTDTPIKHVR